MLKAAILAGDAGAVAAEVRGTMVPEPDSPSSWYVLALAALVQGDDELARSAAQGMREGSEAFDRTADAIAALAEHDGDRYEAALQAIVDDFEGRTEHLTGVAIADTAVVLQRLAAARGMRADVNSPLVPRE